MSTVDEFLKNNPELSDAEIASKAPATTRSSQVVLSGLALAADDEVITFAHLGHRFDVARKDIIDIENSEAAVPNPFGQGQTVNLTVGVGAKFRPHGTVTAQSLVQGTPFAIAQPSEIPDNSYPHHTAAELAWLADNGIEAENDLSSLSTNSGTYCGHNTTSPKWSGTNSNGRQDDGKSDEYYGDDASHDDTGADD